MFLKLSTRDPESFKKLNDTSLNPSAVLLINHYEWNYISLAEPDTFEDIVDYVNSKNIPFYILNGSHERSKLLHDNSHPRYSNVQVISCPTIFNISWFYDFQKRYLDESIKLDPIDFNKNFKYLFLSLNNKPHSFRCMQMDMIAKHELIRYGAISWNSWEGYEGRNIDQCTGYNWKYWEPKILTLDEIENDNMGWTTQLPNEFYHSFIQLIPETTIYAFMLSEKIVPALMFYKIFLVSGSKDYYKVLKSYDILPYDEIFDYSFDDVEDDETRFDMIAKNIASFKNHSMDELHNIYSRLLPKIIHNRNSFYKLVTDLSLWPSFVINLCKNNPEIIRNTDIFHYYNLHSIEKND